MNIIVKKIKDINNDKLLQKRTKLLLKIFIILIICIIVIIITNKYNSSSGVYSPELNLIMIFPKENNTSNQFYVAKHEIGHYVYFNFLTEEDRIEYAKIFYNSNEYISEYSETNVEENFAEEFANMFWVEFDSRGGSESRQEYFEKHFEKMMGR